MGRVKLDDRCFSHRQRHLGCLPTVAKPFENGRQQAGTNVIGHGNLDGLPRRYDQGARMILVLLTRVFIVRPFMACPLRLRVKPEVRWVKYIMSGLTITAGKQAVKVGVEHGFLLA